jgi:hypothetical protein
MLLDIDELNKRLTDKGNIANRFHRKSVPTNTVANPAHIVPNIPVLPQGENKSEELNERRETLPVTQRGGRFSGQPNIPPVLRSLIGTCANLGSIKGTAEAFGVTTTHTQNLKNGRTHANGPTLPYLDLSIKENVAEVRKAVVDTLKTSVSLVAAGLADPELSAKDHSVIARNLASIMAATKEKDEKDEEGNIHYHIHVPKTKQINEYPVIEVNA